MDLDDKKMGDQIVSDLMKATKAKNAALRTNQECKFEFQRLFAEHSDKIKDTMSFDNKIVALLAIEDNPAIKTLHKTYSDSIIGVRCGTALMEAKKEELAWFKKKTYTTEERDYAF